MHINNILDNINMARSLGSTNQCYDVMYTVARAFQVKTVVEIGTHQGASSIAFCQAILDNKYIPKVYTVDSWIQSNRKIATYNKFKEACFSEYITMVEGDSKEVIPKLFSDIGRVDLILIDGDHSLEGVLRDYDNCKNFSNIILFHDTGYGKVIYLKKIEQDGWKVITFPTRYVEGDSHIVGISLAIK
jgi:precorrin-6B methylase 2